MMKTLVQYFIGFLLLTLLWSGLAFANSENQIPDEKDIPMLENPMSEEYLRKNLRKSQPRLVLNAQTEKVLKKKLRTDPVIQNMYRAIQFNAAEVQKKPLLGRVMVGRRLLGTSREMLWRINMLGMVYRIEKDQKVLDRINDEVIAVCNFSDWNPSHYLDVAEMSMAVAFALDWTAGKLPRSTIELATTALIEKGIDDFRVPSIFWISGEIAMDLDRREKTPPPLEIRSLL